MKNITIIIENEENQKKTENIENEEHQENYRKLRIIEPEDHKENLRKCRKARK